METIRISDAMVGILLFVEKCVMKYSDKFQKTSGCKKTKKTDDHATHYTPYRETLICFIIIILC